MLFCCTLLGIQISTRKGLIVIDAIFREYDIRGKIGSEFDINQVYDLACATAYYFVEHNPTVRTVVVGMDGRTHSPQIKDELIRGLTDSGLDVLFVGLCTSPALYFALYNCDVQAGLMITASHNPPEYNGLKICLGRDSVWGTQVKVIRDLYKEKKRIKADRIGTVQEQPIVPIYIDWLVNHFPQLHGMPLSVVIDCGNGAGGMVIPELVRRMAWPCARLLYCEVDGTYPNHEADPVKEKNMADVKRVLRETDTQLGIGLDGDADRMVPMTKNGFLVPGDQLLALFSQDVLAKIPGSAIVFDIKSSSGLSELITQWNGVPCMSPSGHAIIKDQIKKHNAVLGGELSCHFFFNDTYFGYDDGIYTMLRLCALLQETGKTLDSLLKVFPKKYSSLEIRLECADDKKHAIVDDVRAYFKERPDVSLITIDGARVATNYGWGIVRVSNTQPALSMRFEADSPEGLQAIKQEFLAVLAHHFDMTMLKKELGL
jgi:phosphomannomutase / phosphoglucomutase